MTRLATMLCVADIGRSLDFYVDKLGAELRERDEHIALIELDGSLVYVFLESPPTSDKPSIHLSPPPPERPSVILVLLVADCDATYQQLSVAGVEFLTPPQTAPWGNRRCFARDPDGYVLEVEGGH